MAGHFWALALFMRSDYDDAGEPMLTVTHGRRATRVHILVYTVLRGALIIWRRDEDASEGDNFATERAFFTLSLLRLVARFGAILLWALLVPFGLGGWG